MVSLVLVIALIFMTLAVIWTIRSKEWLQTVFVFVGTTMLAIVNPEVPTKVRDSLVAIGKFFVDLFS